MQSTSIQQLSEKVLNPRFSNGHTYGLIPNPFFTKYGTYQAQYHYDSNHGLFGALAVTSGVKPANIAKYGAGNPPNILELSEDMRQRIFKQNIQANTFSWRGWTGSILTSFAVNNFWYVVITTLSASSNITHQENYDTHIVEIDMTATMFKNVRTIPMTCVEQVGYNKHTYYKATAAEYVPQGTRSSTLASSAVIMATFSTPGNNQNMFRGGSVLCSAQASNLNDGTRTELSGIAHRSFADLSFSSIAVGYTIGECITFLGDGYGRVTKLRSPTPFIASVRLTEVVETIQVFKSHQNAQGENNNQIKRMSLSSQTISSDTVLHVQSLESFAVLDVNQCEGVRGCSVCKEVPNCIWKDGTCTVPTLADYKGDLCPPEIDECTTNTDQCHASATCEDTPDSYTCQCDAGYKGNGTSCSDIDECSTYQHRCHHAEAICKNTEGLYTCSCRDGYTGNSTYCTNMNECTTGSHQCSADATCQDTLGSYTCQCNDGYWRDGTSCSNLNECATDIHNCHAGARCKDTVGSYTCECKVGFTGNGANCQNINECVIAPNPCPAHATCQDIEGSYKCECFTGYSRDCTGTCSEIDECINAPCYANAQCTNTPGSYTCTCHNGYTGNSTYCKNIDECVIAPNPCPAHATCQDTEGSYKCECIAGLSSDSNGACSDPFGCDRPVLQKATFPVNSSNTKLNILHAVCDSGFESSGPSNPQATCHSDGTVTVQGRCGHHCSAQKKFLSYHGTKTYNDAVRFCSSHYSRLLSGALWTQCLFYKPGHSERMWLDLPHFGQVSTVQSGSRPQWVSEGELYTTVCESEIKCSDAPCDANAQCTDTPGSYTCTCHNGYTGNSTYCKNIDECVIAPNPCPAHATCQDTEGSYKCECNAGLTRDSTGACSTPFGCDRPVLQKATFPVNSSNTKLNILHAVCDSGFESSGSSNPQATCHNDGTVTVQGRCGHHCSAQKKFLSYHGTKTYNDAVRFCSSHYSRLLSGDLWTQCLFYKPGHSERMWLDLPHFGQVSTVQSGSRPQWKSKGELCTTVCESDVV
ncbi:fibrillin-1-like [Sycon ciliatum]|uniref:fibrillin-1-like n=1 Tax=Sycon ciliatum TaxID=27933 RepID=UPI0031F618B5